MMMMNGRNNRYPFTATQWQELEHQALIFKYMASGHPIPSDLLLPIRRSILLDTTATPASLFTHQNNIAWGCFQMGLGGKVEDPEPGRCRRTDGKKWRCSKEAHPDSKYCERHMHRGKNRSRKPVEAALLNASSNTINNTSSSSITTASNSSHQNSPSYVSSLYPTNNYQLSMGNSDTHDPFYPYSSCPSYSRPPAIGLSPGKFQLDSASSTYTDRDFRYFHGMREDADQYSCFTEASGSETDGTWRFTPLRMSSQGEPKKRSILHQQQKQDCYSHLTETTDLSKEREEEKHQNFFVLGSDFKLQTPSKDHDSSRVEEEEEESRKPLRRFIDEWPLRNKESWIDLEDRSNWASSFTKTQLSISTPMTYDDHFAIANSQSRDGN